MEIGPGVKWEESDKMNVNWRVKFRETRKHAYQREQNERQLLSKNSMHSTKTKMKELQVRSSQEFTAVMSEKTQTVKLGAKRVTVRQVVSETTKAGLEKDWLRQPISMRKMNVTKRVVRNWLWRWKRQGCCCSLRSSMMRAYSPARRNTPLSRCRSRRQTRAQSKWDRWVESADRRRDLQSVARAPQLHTRFPRSAHRAKWWWQIWPREETDGTLPTKMKNLSCCWMRVQNVKSGLSWRLNLAINLMRRKTRVNHSVEDSEMIFSQTLHKTTQSSIQYDSVKSIVTKNPMAI